MNSTERFLTAAEAAAKLGVSAKALRVYEMRGLIEPLRTAAGWRTYGPEQQDRARQIVSLRALGLSLAQVAAVLGGDPSVLAAALSAHQQALETEMSTFAGRLERVRELRHALAAGTPDLTAQLAQLASPRPAVSFSLPWPWGGEAFELGPLGPVTYLTGPLGSGKTRLAMKLAEVLPGAAFVGLDRDADMAALRLRLAADARLAGRVRAALDWLAGDGAPESDTDALVALMVALEAEGSGPLVVDLVEQGLGRESQEALAAWLRQRRRGIRPLVLMTRSASMLDLDALAGEVIVYCPANHSPPLVVRGHAGAAGLDLVASCLAVPEVRERTAGTIAWRPHGAGEATSPR